MFANVFRLLAFTSVFLMTFFLNACYHENKDVIPKPNRLISSDTMVSILTDMQIIEGVISFERLNRINNNNVKKKYLNRMLLHYGITESQLQNNINYYNNNLKKMDKIYDKVLANLSKMENEMKAKKLAREKEHKIEKAIENIPPFPARNNDSIIFLADSLWKIKHNNIFLTF